MERMIFNTKESSLSYRNGQTVTVLETRDISQSSNRASHMMLVRFRDGFEAPVFPDELTALTSAAPKYRDTL